jgi:hypothetical protein
MERHIVLNSVHQVCDDPHVGRVELGDPGEIEIAIFQPSWTGDDWLAHAQQTEVQAVAAGSILRTAEEI